MRLLGSGERRALEELANRHLAAVAYFCGRCLSDAAAGEEVAQEVFLGLWRERGSYGERQRFREYLYTAAVNRCRNRGRWWRRWLRRREQLAEQPPVAPDTPLEMLVEREREQELSRAVAALPPGLREALLLRFGQGLDYRAIGAALGCSEVAARTRVFRAVKLLKQDVRQ
jgi:RNA polymerase sigma-70 factor (ECF subfamily)